MSPYAGFGLGAFFHDGTVTTTSTFILVPSPRPFSNTNTVGYEDSRFAYQIMGGLSVRASRRFEFHLGYRFRSSRGAAIDEDHVETGIRFRF